MSLSINMTDALKSLKGFRDNYNWNFNLSNYSSIENFTKINSSDVSNATTYFFTPISDYWLYTFGSWFYVILVYFCSALVYIKSKSIFPTSMVLLLMANLVAVPATMGAVLIPYEVLSALYLSIVISTAGVLYSLLVGRE